MATVEIPEVNVTGQLIPIQELDRVKSAVCLLRSTTKDPSKSWSGTGFYVNVKLKKPDKVLDLHCIMTNYHVFLEKEKRYDDMVAVFHHDSTEKEDFELSLVPFKLHAQSKGEDLDYVLIRINENLQRSIASIGVKPILADITKLPMVRMQDTVYIIQHPEGMKKHLSQDTVRRVNKPFIEYYADTLRGSSGSPVFVLNKSKLSLVALHSKGVLSYSESNWNKGVLLSEILDHLHTGKVTKPTFSPPGVPDQIESGVLGTKDPSKQVTREDIMYIAKDITDVWEELGRVLGHSDSTLKIINADNSNKIYNKCYEMLIKWTQIKVSKATYGVLAAGFVHPAVDRPDLVTKYC